MAFAYFSEDADTKGAVLVNLSGNFGWSVMPFVMEVGTLCTVYTLILEYVYICYSDIHV